MDPATFDTLREKNCLLADGTVDTAAVVTILVSALEANHVAHSIGDVSAAAVTAGQLAADIFASNNPELAKLAARLMSTGLRGKVQTALSNGYMLCGTRSKIAVELPGGELRSFSVASRFLSDDPDTIKTHLLDPTAKKAVSAATTASKLGETVKGRRPEMADRVDEWTGQLQFTFQTALTAGSAP